MKIETTDLKLVQKGLDWYLGFIIPNKHVEKIKKLCDTDKVKTVEVKQKRNKRSLDANAALWVMLDKMAKKMHTTKDELYIEMLDRYGVFTHIIVKPEAVHRVKEEWRTVRQLGPVTIKGKTGIQLQCFFGSSQYNTEEFSKLLEGVIEEAKLIGVEFISKEDLTLMLEEWGK